MYETFYWPQADVLFCLQSPCDARVTAVSSLCLVASSVLTWHHPPKALLLTCFLVPFLYSLDTYLPVVVCAQASGLSAMMESKEVNPSTHAHHTF